jgi:hypothetical protein
VKAKDLKAIVDQGIHAVIEFTEGVNDLEVDPDVRMRCKVLRIDDFHDSGLRLMCDFTEFDQYNRAFAKSNYFDKQGNPTQTWMQQEKYTRETLQAYTLYAGPDDDICVIVDDKYARFWKLYQKENTKESYVSWLERNLKLAMGDTDDLCSSTNKPVAYTSSAKTWWQKHSDRLGSELDWNTFCEVWMAALNEETDPSARPPCL